MIRVLRSMVVGVSVLLALLVSEAAVRVIDGYPLWPIELPVKPPAATRDGQPSDNDRAIHYARAVPLAPAVDARWYLEDPPPPARHAPMSWVMERLERYPGNETRLFEFNRRFLADRLCNDIETTMFGTQPDFLFFDPPGDSIYPSYRHLRRLSAPGWFTSNGFGFRGPELTVDKPAGTIRIAFVGASTTIGEYDFPFSYPELIGGWLNRWAETRGLPARFEITNAARTGIDSHSITAIVRDEVVPLEPDLVVFYAFSNQFWPAGSIGYRFGRLYSKPESSQAAAQTGPRSALGIRVRGLLTAWAGGGGSEPMKPVQWIRWNDVDEMHPDSRDPRLPVELPAIVADLSAMHDVLSAIHAELVLVSYAWMAMDGLRLELPRQLGLFNYLNRDYWPASYDTMRRLADLQNRTYRDFAARRALPFIDVASRFPLDPELFVDAIHLNYAATRLQAWMIFQDLVRVVDDRLRAKTLPRPMANPGRRHPAFDQQSPRTITRDAILADCAQTL